MGSKQSTATSTSTSAPWDKQQPYIEKGMAEAQKIYNSQGPSYFPQSTVAGFSPQQEQAFGLGANRAVNGNSTMKAAEGYSQDVLNGKYSGDPYAGQVFDNIQSKVVPTVNSQFSEAGRYGSPAQAGTMTRALTESFAPYASQQYQASLDRMGQAANMAPTYATNDYQDISALSDIGAQRQDLAQQELNDAQARWNYLQDLPANKLGQYMGFIGGNYGGTTTSAQPYYKPGIGSQILGGLTGLAGLFG